MSKVPLTSPLADGANATCAGQLAPAARVLQLCESVKPAGTASTVSVTTPPPLLVRVTVRAAEVVPMSCGPKSRLEAESVSAGPDSRAKVAVTDLAAFIATWQLPVPVHAPDQ